MRISLTGMQTELILVVWFIRNKGGFLVLSENLIDSVFKKRNTKLLITSLLIHLVTSLITLD